MSVTWSAILFSIMKKLSRSKCSPWIVVSGILTVLVFIMLTSGIRTKFKLPLSADHQDNTWDYSKAQNLTGGIYIGAKSFQLVYLCNTKQIMGRFVLKSPLESFYPSVILREEDCFTEGFDTVVFSRETQNSKFIISSHIGDTTNKQLIEIDPITYQLTNFETLDFGDSYYKYNQVINWLDETNILVKTTEKDPNSLDEKITFWKAPYNNLTKKTVLSI